MGFLGAAGEQNQFTYRNFFVVFLVSLGQLGFGYPASIIGTTPISLNPSSKTYADLVIFAMAGTTLGEPSFLIYMGLLVRERAAITDSITDQTNTSGRTQQRRCSQHPPTSLLEQCLASSRLAPSLGSCPFRM